MNPVSIYIHMPFCKTKCPYCDFASFADPDDKRYLNYTQALINEIKLRLPVRTKQKINTIFFGGGTPSLHSPQEYQMIFDALREYFDFAEDIEITLEANPGTIDRTKLEALINTGVNRISIGVQTFDENLLQKLGRGHSVADSLRSIADLQNLKLKSWSFDLIYGLPGQSLASWLATVDQALSFNPPHISAYALSIEKNTGFGKLYGNSKHSDLPLEDEVTEMYEQGNEKFAAAGLERYEISNWSKNTHEAKHNLTYWQAQGYYAFGLSSHGYIEGTRYANTRDLIEYMNYFSVSKPNTSSKFNFSFVQEQNKIPVDEKLEEEIILKLRLKTGLKLTDQINEKIDFKSLENLKNRGFVTEASGVIRLTDKAMMLSNAVINQLLK